MFYITFLIATVSGLRNYVFDGVQIPKGKGQFSGAVRAIQKHWQSSLERSLLRGCRVLAFAAKEIIQYARQAQIVF